MFEATIIVDDLKPILGCYGDPFVKTPNIDRFAKEGVVFTNTYCQQAVCGPSRASFLTGMRPDYTGVWDLETEMRNINPEILSMPQFFKQNGYITAGIGKVFDSRSVDENIDKPSWSIPFYKKSNDKFKDHFVFISPGYSLRPLEIEASVGLVQLKKLNLYF